MYYPWNWMDLDQQDPEVLGAFELGWKANYDIPSNACNDNSGVKCNSNAFKGGIYDYFTNDTWISNMPWIPKALRTPANKPGKAPIYGEGCGVNGGNIFLHTFLP